MFSPEIVVFLLSGSIFFFYKFFKERNKSAFNQLKKRMNSYLPSHEKTKSKLNIFNKLAQRAYNIGLVKLTEEQIKKESKTAGIVILLVSYFAFEQGLLSSLLSLLGIIYPLQKIWARERNQLYKERQIQEAINKMIASMNSSGSMLYALQAATTVDDPVGRELRNCIYQINNGMLFEEALNNFAKIINTDDAKILTKGLIVANDRSIDIAKKLMKTTSDIINERESMRNALAQATSESRVTLNFIGYCPSFIFFMLLIFKTEITMFFITHPVGIGLLLLAVTLNLVGFLICKKILDTKRLLE